MTVNVFFVTNTKYIIPVPGNEIPLVFTDDGCDKYRGNCPPTGIVTLVRKALCLSLGINPAVFGYAEQFDSQFRIFNKDVVKIRF